MSDDAALVRAAQAGDTPGSATLLERHRALLHAVAVGHARSRAAGRGRRARHVPDRAAADRRAARPGRRARVAARDPRQRLPRRSCAARRPSPVRRRRPSRRPATPVDEAIDRARAARLGVDRARASLAEPLRRRGRRCATSRGASSYEAIADLCGVPVGTVRSRLNAARAQARRRAARDGRRAPPGRRRAGELAVADRRRDDALRAHGRRERAARRAPRRPALPCWPTASSAAAATHYAARIVARPRGRRDRRASATSSSAPTSAVDRAVARQPARPAAALPARRDAGPLPRRRTRRVGSSRTTRRALADSNP